MAVVVGVHGIAQERKGAEVLLAEWEPALLDGVRASGAALDRGSVVCAFYGGLFRPVGVMKSGTQHFDAHDLNEGDAELLALLWANAAVVEPDRVVAPDAEDLRASTPRSVQAALRALSSSKAFAGLTESMFIGALKQVTRYFADEAIRTAAQDAVDALVDTDTRVIVGHSLGSVVAYEALVRFGRTSRWRSVRSFVTLGSPLGIANLIFHRLSPPPVDGVGVHPGVAGWTNVSDGGDVVALQKRLAPRFGQPLVDIEIDNGADSHSIVKYLTAPETGAAIAYGLS